MKKRRIISFCMAASLLLGGCGKLLKSEYAVGTDIQQADVTEFYYTYENINYNACYLRYRFFAEDGKYYFYHEARERKDDYGPTTEADITAKGTVELTEAQWAAFFDCLRDGTVVKRGVSAESGGRGPWTYLYWTGDKSEYQEFSFASLEKRGEFEELCEKLVQDRS